MATLAELESDVRQALDESASDPAVFTSADIRRAINEGDQSLSEVSEWYRVTTPFPLWANRTYYDLRGICSQPVLSVRGIHAPTPARWLRGTSPRELDLGVSGRSGFASSLDWGRVSGSPNLFFMRSVWWLGVYAQASADGEIVHLDHTALPPKMREDYDSPLYPEEFHVGVFHYAMYDLLVDDKEVSKALEHWEEYVLIETALKEYADAQGLMDRVIQFGEESPL